MAADARATYDAFYRRSLDDPEGFWLEAAQRLDWTRQPDRAFEQPDPPSFRWFPGGRTNSETLILNEPGTLYYPRYNQLDLNIKKNFRSGQKVFTFQVDCFNVLNSNSIITQNNAIGSNLGQVNSIQLGRLPRIAFQMKF